MTSFNGHVSRSNHTHATPSWASPSRYSRMDRRAVEHSIRSYENAVNHEQNRASATRTRLQEKLAKREFVRDTTNDRMMDLTQGLLAQATLAVLR